MLLGGKSYAIIYHDAVTSDAYQFGVFVLGICSSNGYFFFEESHISR